jgi:hypothetical protein
VSYILIVPSSRPIAKDSPSGEYESAFLNERNETKLNCFRFRFVKIIKLTNAFVSIVNELDLISF